MYDITKKNYRRTKYYRGTKYYRKNKNRTSRRKQQGFWVWPFSETKPVVPSKPDVPVASSTNSGWFSSFFSKAPSSKK